jgi:hypothetical protein
MLQQEAAAVYVIFSALGLMYYNTNTRPRREGELSAYSIFNPGGRRLLGDISSQQIQDEFLNRGGNQQSAQREIQEAAREIDEGDDEDAQFERELQAAIAASLGENKDGDSSDLRRRTRLKPNDDCYCNSGLKYKRCCSIIDSERTRELQRVAAENRRNQFRPF